MIVVSMIVKDSLTRVREEVFKKVLDSTLQIPYESFILVSDGSDGTEGFVKNGARTREGARGTCFLQ
jgi:hypothetical protein